MDVEVIFPDVCSAYYEAKLLDVDTANGRCQVGFDNDWKPKTWARLQEVRYAPSSSGASLELTPGMKVEAYLPHKEGEPQGWWAATITKCKGEVAGIRFLVGDQEFTDLVETSNLRLPNESSSLSQVEFYQKDFPVPDELQDFCSDVKVHQNFRTKVKALGVSYNTDRQSLVVVADSKSSLQRAEILIDIHLADLATQAALLSKTQKLQQNSQPSSTVTHPDSGIHEEKFYIHPDCIGFAMGKQGWNVNQAREIEGIISIDFDDNYSQFTIRAYSKEAAEEARDLIEFTRELVFVPRDLAGKVIGRGGNVVQQILEKSRLNNIKVIGDEEARQRNVTTDGKVPFELLGRRNAIENAKLMLDYHLDHLREINHILQDQEEITKKLRDSGLDDVPTYYPRPNPPRSYGGPPSRGTRGRGGYGRGRRPRRERRSERPQRREEQDNEEESESSEEHENREESSPLEEDSPAPDRRRKRGHRNQPTASRETEDHESSTEPQDKEPDWPEEGEHTT